MRIYRIEHKRTRLGPWRYATEKGGWFDCQGSDLPCMHGLHAHEYGKAKGIDKKYLRLGTRTLSQLFQWFSEADLTKLAVKDFVLRVYNVPETILEDDYQVLVHIPARKRPIITHSLLDVQNSD